RQNVYFFITNYNSKKEAVCMGKKENLANQLIEFMGGSDNIESITHCATRLRPTIKDSTMVQKEKIEKLNGVTGVVFRESGLQIIIGTNVEEVYKAIMNVLNSNTTNTESTINNDKSDNGKKHNWFNAFIALVVSIFSPLLPLLAGSGLLRGFTILANELGW